jgi:two-component system sensor histidine kinase ChvG
VAGYHYVRDMEEFLREDQNRAVLATASALATALQTRVELFRETPPASSNNTPIYIQPLAFAPLIDGYDQDWEQLATPSQYKTDRLIAGSYQEYLYLLLNIRDPQVSFNSRQAQLPPHGDYLKLRLTDSPGYERSWLMAANAPGRMSLSEISPPRGEILSAYPDDRLQGAMQTRPGGYWVELRIPVALLGTALAIEIHDDKTKVRQLPNSGSYTLEFPSQAIGQLLDNLSHNPGERIWITDRQRRVLARSEQPNLSSSPALPAILRWLLPEMESRPLNLADEDHRLNGPELNTALDGTPASRWREQTNLGQYRLSAAYPIRRQTQVIGAVVVEQDAQNILALRLRALAELLVSSLLSFAIAGLGILLVASSMVRRLRRLRHSAAQAIDSHGRIRNQFEAPEGNDEIGDLGQSFAQLFSRLTQYNLYLEQLASRLSHELRTPLTIIRSSLDNLAMSQEANDPGEVYQQRARQGVERLETIIKRMSEAARLEQALASTHMHTIDVVKLITAAMEAHQQAWPQFPLEADLPTEELQVSASADLLLQALDKLFSNARDFSPSNKTIRVSLESQNDALVIAIENYGPALPPGNTEHLFDSMVSQRSNVGQQNPEPHLGLGLYVVRLIAECHGGNPFAENLLNGHGVRIGFTIGNSGSTSVH